MDSLDDVLSGEPEVVEPETPEPQQQEATGEVGQSDQEDSTPPVEDNTEESVHQDSPQEKAYLAKAQDEKRKRQELEAKYATVEARLAQLETPKQSEEEIDYWDDPKKVIDSTVNDRLGALETNFNNRLLSLSENMAKRTYSDYDEVLDFFQQEVMQNQPHILQQAMQQTDPAEFLYKTAKAQKELAEVGDIDQLKAKLRAEVKAEIEAETKSSFEAELEKRASLPGTLANQRATSGPTGTESESLEDIFGR